MKNLNSQSLKASIVTLKDWIVKYRISIFIFIVATILGFMLLRISNMATLEPTDTQKVEAKASIKIVRVNEDAISVIKNLQDKNISVETLFDPGRYDPFSD